MLNLAAIVAGPLAGPECRRAVARGWLILVRGLAAAAILGVVLLTLWFWWIQQNLESSFRPYTVLRGCLVAVEGMLVTIALVFSPAVLAGSLAGERERGTLALLLTTRVSAREVVTGRLVGKLSQVAMILLGGVPGLVGIAALAGFSFDRIGILLLVPSAVAFGAGGLAALASTVSRRGRDALLAVYLTEVVLMLAPLLGAALAAGAPLVSWGSAINPYYGLLPLLFEDQLAFSSATIGLWLVLGLAATATASWRLRPSCLRANEGERILSSRRRRGFVPPIYENRPMVWKELFIERVATLGRFGRWVGLLLVVALLAGSLSLTALIVFDPPRAESTGLSPGRWAQDQMEIWIGQTGVWLTWLIELAIGLRAAVSIASERERGTWDALLTSPLDGSEIVRGKLRGSLFALKWLILAAFSAWTLATIVEAVPLKDSARWGAEVLVIGAFMAAVGVRTSLTCQTAAQAMALTSGFWLGAGVFFTIPAFLLLASTTLVGNALRMAAGELGLLPPQTTFWAPVAWSIAWPVARCSVYLVATLLIVLDTRLRFDRLAGRMTEGRAAVAFESLIHGRPEAPILLDMDVEDPNDRVAPIPVIRVN